MVLMKLSLSPTEGSALIGPMERQLREIITHVHDTVDDLMW